MTSVSAIVVAYGESPWLPTCVDALLASTGVTVEVVIVDNGAPAVKAFRDRDRVVIVEPGDNLGFAGGCNAGVAASSGEVVALVNPDAIVEPPALAALAAAAVRPDVGIATASLRLADAPDTLNSAGNDVHFLGFGWSGHFNEPASVQGEGPVTAGSGAAMALRRAVWDELGGFDEHFFMYHEDADISLRSWQRDRQVWYVPDAVVLHHYDYGRNPRKHGLLERNRLAFVLALYERRTLLLLAPALALVEVGVIAEAVAQGWLKEKVDSWRWLLAHRAWLRERRAMLQSARVVRDRELAPLFSTHMRPGNYQVPVYVRPVEWLLARYWSLVRRLL